MTTGPSPGSPMRRLCVEARSWRGDPLIQELKLPLRALLFELHTLATDLGEWPLIPSDPARVAAMLRLNVRPVDNGLKDLRQRHPPLLAPVTGDPTHLQLRPLDAVALDPPPAPPQAPRNAKRHSG